MLALALAAAISLLLGHLVTVATLAIIVARRRRRRGARRARFVAPVLVAAGVLTFFCALLLFNFSSRADHERVEAPPLAVVSSGVRARLIAIDGFDAAIARGLSERGQIPAIAALFDGAVARLDIDDTRDPARAWTTIATGRDAGASCRARARDTARRRCRGLAGHGRTFAARPSNRRRDRSDSPDATVDREPARSGA